MLCSNCGFDNPSVMKFCGDCGSPLPLPEPEASVCPTCRHSNRPGSRFCGECGTTLPARPDSRAHATQHALPLAPTAPPRRSDDERKIVTMIFGDIAGFTAMAEQLDPEEVKLISDKCLALLTNEVHRYDGKVDKYMGDNIMVLFGAPVAHEDDPERAVRCALEMQRSIKSLSDELRRKRGFTLDLHIGINTGEVMAGIMGGNREQDYTVMGDAVNLAARLQHAAEVGKILVGETTFRATQAIIEYRELPPLRVRGKAQLVPVWEVIGVQARRDEQRRQGVQATMQGRDSQFSDLKLIYHAVEQSAALNLVLIYGAAGIGKSRFLYEFEKYIDGLPEEVAYLKGRSLPYGGSDYAALIEMIRRDCGITDDDSRPDAQRKLAEQIARLYLVVDERATQVLSEEVNAVAARLSFLLNLDESDNPLARIDTESRRDELFWGLRRYFERKASQTPLVLAFEDIHWAGRSLLEFLDHLLATAHVPILIVCLARPDLLTGSGDPLEAQARRGWVERVQASRPVIVLNLLSEADCSAILAELVGSANLPNLPDHLCAHIIAAAEGNPLYIEETVRMLVDSSAGREGQIDLSEVRIPDSIQTLIGARIDGLDPNTKRALQAASVVGRIFWAGAVAHLYQPEPPLTVDGVLRTLVEREFIVERLGGSRFAGEREFSFRSTLIRDVAYNSLPKARRFQEHERLAGWVEERTKGRTAEFSDLIAYHYEQAAKLEREVLSLAQSSSLRNVAQQAIRYLRAAGDHERSRQNISTAADFYARALDLCRSTNAGDEEYVALLCAHATMLEVLAKYDEALTELGIAAALAQQLGDDDSRACALTQMAEVYSHQSSLTQAGMLASEALDLFREGGNKAGEANALAALGEIALAADDLPQAQDRFRQLYTICSNNDDLSGQARALFQLGKICCQRDDYKEATWFLQEAQTLFNSLGDKRGAAYCLSEIGITYATLGLLQRAEGYYAQARDLMRTLGDRQGEAQVIGNLAYVYLRQGRLSEAERVAQQSAQLATELGSRRQQVAATLMLGRIQLAKGEHVAAERSFREAQAASDRFGLRSLQPAILVGLAAANIGLGNGSAAISYAEAGSTLVGSEEQIAQADLRRVLGLGQAMLNDPAAEDNLRAAVTMAQASGYPYPLAENVLALADYLAAAGRDAEATEARLLADRTLTAVRIQDGSEAMTQVLLTGKVGLGDASADKPRRADRERTPLAGAAARQPRRPPLPAHARPRHLPVPARPAAQQRSAASPQVSPVGAQNLARWP